MNCPVGRNIKKTREEKGITQEQLGKSIGLTSASVCRIETGVSDPSTSMISKIAKALNCDPISFFFCEERIEDKNLEALEFWKRVSQKLNERAETRPTLCSYLGIDGKNFLFWERNCIMPSFDIILKIAAYLEIDVYWLVYGDSIPNSKAMREELNKCHTLSLDEAKAEIDALRKEIEELKGKAQR